MREPRLRRVLYGRVTSYPVIDQFEEQLSKPFYFRQRDHGSVIDVLFPKSTESPQVAALKKGMIHLTQWEREAKAHSVLLHARNPNRNPRRLRSSPVHILLVACIVLCFQYNLSYCC